MLDRSETMLTFTEFAAKSNGFRPQEDHTFALIIGSANNHCNLGRFVHKWHNDPNS